MSKNIFRGDAIFSVGILLVGIVGVCVAMLYGFSPSYWEVKAVGVGLLGTILGHI